MRKPAFGFFTQFETDNIGPLFLLRLKLCYANGVDAVFFSINDLDMENEIVNSYAWTHKGLVREKTRLPYFLEYGGGTTYREYFRSRVTLIDDFNLSKKAINELLIKTELANMVIPSVYTAVPQKVLAFTSIWKETIIKPLVGARGEGIICINPQSQNKFLFTDANQNGCTLSYEESLEKLAELYSGTTVIAQPRLHFINKDGQTMDFRINTTKDGEGNWKTVFIIPRTSRDSIVSNFSHGGYASMLEPTLKLDYMENADKVLEALEMIANKLPPLVENASGCNVLSLGIDVGFDYETLNPYIIEVNYVPKLTFPDKLKYYYIQSDYITYFVNKNLPKEV